MKRYRYRFSVILSAVLFGMLPSVVSLAYDSGFRPMSAIFFTSLLLAPVNLTVAAMTGHKASLKRSEIPQMLLISLAGTGTNLLLWSSYSFLPTGMAVSLHYLYPIFTTLILILFYKEPMGPRKLVALAVCVCGVVLISLKGISASLPGIVLAILSGMTWAIYIVMLDKSPAGRVSPFVTGFYVNITRAAVTGVICLCVRAPAGNSPIGWVYLGLGAVLTLFASALLQLGTNRVGSFSAAIFSTFEPITAVAISVTILRDSLTPLQLLGVVLVLSGVILNSQRGPSNPNR